MKKAAWNTQRNVEQRPQLLLLTPKIGTTRAKPNEAHGGQWHDITKTCLCLLETTQIMKTCQTNEKKQKKKLDDTNR